MMAAPRLSHWLILLMTLAATATADEEFQLQSPDIGPDKEFSEEFTYDAFGCSGNNQSFAVSWSGAPAGTQSFAIALFDPDALRGKGFWHWFVINIPATTTELPRGAGNRDNSKLPAGARQLRNSFNKASYGGPCPRRGDQPHSYAVTVYALKTRKLELPQDALAEEALPLVEANALGKATLTYKYGRT
jgi:Raf kinase inhibitor-like YbhB/YbcL family protein